MKTWSVYIIVYKFVRKLKVKMEHARHGGYHFRPKYGSLVSQLDQDLRPVGARRGIFSLFQPMSRPRISFSLDRSSDKTPQSPGALPQSITRQLAFGQLAPEFPSARRSADFYNSRWSNLLAKVFTVIVLLATAALMVIFYIKEKKLNELYHHDSSIFTAINQSLHK